MYTFHERTALRVVPRGGKLLNLSLDVKEDGRVLCAIFVSGRECQKPILRVRIINYKNVLSARIFILLFENIQLFLMRREGRLA